MLRALVRPVPLLLAAATLAGCGGGGSGAHGGDAPSTAATTTVPAAAGAGRGTAAALALQHALVSVVVRVSPSVVQVATSQGLGAGVVFDSKGHVVTNAHVVGDARTFTVTTRSGKQYRAKLVGRFVPDDLAVIDVPGASLRPAVFGDSSKLSVGDLAIAIGNPLGLRSSVTDGIVSALGRTVGEPNGATLPSAIQTSAPINPGNSGGALADIQGQVIGIPTLAAVDPELGGSAAPGIGFAIPSNVVRDIASQIVAHGHVVNSHRAYLGVQVGDTGGRGVYVGVVQKGGPAAKAGLRPGEIIVSLDGRATPTTADLSDVLARLAPGARVAVVVETQTGRRQMLHVTLGQYPGG
jgi:S1-C subfamily serine protease